MKRFLSLLLLVGCKSAASNEPAPIPTNSPVPSQEARAAGHCRACNIDVYQGHRCKLTVPCALCRREHGARHYHEVAWKCAADGTVMRDVHICNDSKMCETCLHATNGHPRCDMCKEGRHAALIAKGCDSCFRESPVVAVRGITAYCGECNLEVGANHLHGKTVFCGDCLRETGQGHVHDVTVLCLAHERECAVDHQHGRTEYCQACRRDVGPNHKHGDTIWCIRCTQEVPWPHCHHVGP